MSVLANWWDSKDEREKTKVIRMGCTVVSALALGTAGFIFGRKYEREHILDNGSQMTVKYGWDEQRQKLYIHPEILDAKGSTVMNCGYGFYTPDQVKDVIFDMYQTTVWPNGSSLTIIDGVEALPTTEEA